MKKIIIFISILLLISTSVFVYLRIINSQYAIIFKTINILLIFVVAFIILNGNKELYTFLILLGLFFSILGDIFLCLEKPLIMLGIIAFLITHIFYIVAFLRLINNNVFKLLSMSIFPILAYISGLLVSIPLFIYITSISILIKCFALLYFFVLLFLVSVAFSLRYIPELNKKRKVFIFVGSLLFLVSDILLAFNFVIRIPLLSLWNSITYLPAQLLITLSCYKG